jgi:hypothetical protein
LSVVGSERLGPTEYAELVGRVHSTVAACVPPGASLLMVSKGDAALLELPGHRAAHFPQDGAGEYAGHHPRDSVAATAELERLRRGGAEYLVIPATASWWLDHYREFARHLANHGEVVANTPDACLIYELGRLGGHAGSVPELVEPRASVDQIRDFLENLIPTDSRVVVLDMGDGVAAQLAPLKATALGGGGGERRLGALEREISAGAEYLVVPRSADEWLEEHAELGAELEALYAKLADQRHLCRVFALGAGGEGKR